MGTFILYSLLSYDIYNSPFVQIFIHLIINLWNAPLIVLSLLNDVFLWALFFISVQRDQPAQRQRAAGAAGDWPAV